MNATEIELEHATRYATEATKLFLYEEYRKAFPHVFGKGVVVETRPAMSNVDYFVPESIRDKCIVVTETRFEDESSCLNLACFPVKDDGLRLCEKRDEPRWIGIGKSHYFLACQPACRDDRFRYALDTEWKNGKCFEVNPHKKMLAMNPEKLFSLRPKNYGGLEWNDGYLALTKEYCEAYGLQFYERNKTCYSSQAQDVGEFFTGKTIYRDVHKKIHGTGKLVRDPPPTTDPKTLLAAGPNANKSVVGNVPTIDVPEPESTESLAKEIARDLSIDTGVDLATDLVADVLKKRVPKLIERASRSVAVKQAVKSAVSFNVSSLAIKLSVLAGKSLTGASNVLMVVGIVGLVLDIIDAADYDKVLDPVRLAKIVRKLDMDHFDHEITMRVVTPEYVWDHVLSLDGDDQSRRYAFMSEKIDEYLEALHRVPEDEKREVRALPSSYRKPKEKFFESHTRMLQVVVFLSMCLMLCFDNWIHVWGLLQLIAIVAIESS